MQIACYDIIIIMILGTANFVVESGRSFIHNTDMIQKIEYKKIRAACTVSHMHSAKTEEI